MKAEEGGINTSITDIGFINMNEERMGFGPIQETDWNRAMEGAVDIDIAVFKIGKHTEQPIEYQA